MRRKLHILILMTVALLTASDLLAETFWKEVFYNDFGGNAETDPLIGQPLSLSEFDYLEYDPEVRYGYAVLKHWDSNPNWYNGGDHTFEGNRETGYFVIFNPGNNQDAEPVAYRTKLEGLCRGVNFRFSAWVANMVITGMEGANKPPKLAVGVFEGPTPTTKVSQNAYKTLTVPTSTQSRSSSHLDWQKLSIEFSLNSELDYAYFIVSMVGPEGMGWDFAIDDIKIEVEQPVVSVSHNDIYYGDPLTLEASFDNNGFFADLNNVEYRWEYSANGTDFQPLKTNSYVNDKNFSYTIDAFDKSKHNGYYRVRIGEKGNLDSEICSLVKDVQINETIDKKNVVLCAGEVTTMDDGTVINASQYKTGDVKKNEATNIYYYITVKEPKKITLGDEYVCIGTPYNLRYEPFLGNVYDSEQKIPVSLEYKDENGCVDSTESWIITVSGPKTVSRADKVICQGQQAYEKTYETAGVFDITEPDPVQDCVDYVYTVTVNPTYDMTETISLCQGETFNGKVYGEIGGPFYDSQTYKTKSCGCDSVVGYTINVTGKTYTYLDPVTICYGESYEFDGVTYSDPGVHVLDKVYSNSSTGCDSIVQLRLTILDRYENKDNPIDTTICYDSKLFGVVYPEPTKEPILVRDPKTYESSTGCDSIVWFNLTVLQIQLKLEIKSDRNVVCRGEEVEIYIKELEPKDVPYTWYPDLGGASSTKKVFTPSGDLDCFVKAERVIDEQHTCQSTDTIHVFVRESPTLNIDSIDQKENLVVYNVMGGTEPYSIALDKKDVGTEPSGELRESPIGTHKLVATDANQCTDEAYFDIEPIPVIPSEYFTPNKDGLNDTWFIENIDVYPRCNVKVYDRLGRVVYDKNSYDNEDGWDGTYNGKPLPSTDYWYVINLPESDIQIMGHFTLLR